MNISASPDFRVLMAADVLYLLAVVFHLWRKNAAGYISLLAGIAVHSWFLVSLTLLTGSFMPNTIYSGEVFVPWFMAAMILIQSAFSKNKRLAASAAAPLAALSVFFTFYTLILSHGRAIVFAPGPDHSPYWRDSFLFIETLSYSCFFMSAWFAWLFYRGRKEAEFFHNYLVLAFALFSISQVIGAAWSYLGWAVPFHLSSDRHYVCAALWLFLAWCLHLRFMPGWDAKKRALALVAAVPIVLYFKYLPFLMVILSKREALK